MTEKHVPTIEYSDVALLEIGAEFFVNLQEKYPQFSLLSWCRVDDIPDEGMHVIRLRDHYSLAESPDLFEVQAWVTEQLQDSQQPEVTVFWRGDIVTILMPYES